MKLGQVIYHNFSKNVTDDVTDSTAEVTQAEAYLMLLAAELDEADFWDIVEAINEPNGAQYNDLDVDLKKMHDKFWAYNNAG